MNRAADLWMRPLAGLVLALMAVVVMASAWLRLAGAPRPDCDTWPLCRFDRPVAATIDPAAPPGLSRVRLAHRVAASAALVAIVALLVGAWRSRDRAARRVTAGLLALALGLSMLGIATPGSRLSAVMLGNLLGGALMFALAWVLWRGLDRAEPMPPRLRRGAALVALLWLAQAALGALSGAGAGAIATLLHLLLALLLPIAGFVLALALQRAQRGSEAHSLLAVLALQIVLGVAGALSGAAPALVVAHNAAAAVGLALLSGWAFAGERLPAG